MGLTYVSQISLSLLVPSVSLSIGTVSIGLSASLNGNLALAANLTATPPTLSSSLMASEMQSESLELCLSPEWLPPPLSVSFTVSDTVTLSASLNASLSVHLPALNLLLSAAAEIYAFSYVGVANAMGAAVTTELATMWPDGAPTTGNCTALIFGAITPAPPAPDAQVILPQFLKGMTFGSGLVYTNKIGLSIMCPSVASAATQGSASISAAISASASLSAAAALPPPTFASMITAQANFYASLEAQASLAVAVPSASFSINAALSAAAKISANFGASCSLGAVLASGAVFFIYEYTGAANGLGPALTTALAMKWGDGVTPTTGVCTAAILGATDSISIAAMLGFFGGA